MKSAELRTAFLNYFKEKGHEIVASSPLVPANDPTLLFTNAGMVQFKDVFLGQEQRSYVRATTSQRCVRAGGKHNDLENVGYTARHHTFFEMLGNFSFGDYFKREAIQFAWEFLTLVLKLPEQKLWVTVYEDDQEAEDIWLNEMGVSVDRFSRLGEKDNFWAMGDTGPCGPCSEIFYDHGSDVAGGPPGSPAEDGDRYIEIWNLVFMQFQRDQDGALTPLPKPSVDTGMGLERIAAVMQNVHSNYEIDLFQNLLAAVAQVTKTKDKGHKSLRVIADHIRSCAFLIVDGVIPSNEGRGYVLRRIIRRAIRHGHKLGVEQAFFHRLAKPLSEQMGEAYPELASALDNVAKILLAEEVQFAKTLDNGMAILNQVIKNLPGSEIPGETIFKLYDTFGFPTDLTADIAREKGLSLDMDEFENAMEKQKEQSRETGGFDDYQQVKLESVNETDFTGYQKQSEADATVLALFHDGLAVEKINQGQKVIVVLDKTPFYAESGGQVGDSGFMHVNSGSLSVQDTIKQGGVFLHIGEVESGSICLGDSISVNIDAEKRQATVLNHSSTHLMHAALREILGNHVLQKGSLVDSQHLRFDFSHTGPVTNEELRKIENLVNEQIRFNTLVVTDLMDMESAKAKGAMALFGEKYADTVRVLTMGENAFSVELCGGTHVNRTGDIGVFKIISETGIAAGIRRIEALSGAKAAAANQHNEQSIDELAKMVKTSRESLATKVQQLMQTLKKQDKELQQLKAWLASSTGSDLSAQAEEIKGVKVLSVVVDNTDPKSLRDAVDQLKNKLNNAVIVLGTVHNGKVNLVAGVTKQTTDKIKAGDLVNMVAQQVGGRGGGRADMAMAGGPDIDGIDQALASVKPWVTSKL